MDGGFSWIYDTATDADLPSGWRLNGAGRYFIWDVAPDAGVVTYDNFSVRPVPVKATLAFPANNATGLDRDVPGESERMRVDIPRMGCVIPQTGYSSYMRYEGEIRIR